MDRPTRQKVSEKYAMPYEDSLYLYTIVLEKYCDELENEFANLKGELMRFKDVNRCLANLCDERNETIRNLSNRIDELEKAFCKACEMLKKMEEQLYPKYEGNFSEHQWKEYFMKGEFKNEI